MNPFEHLTAPLLHVKRQFKQNCLFMYDGAVFLSTPDLICQVRTHGKSPEDLIVIDASGYPVFVPSNALTWFLNEAVQTLKAASLTFLEDKKKAEQQFASLLTLAQANDETTE